MKEKRERIILDILEYKFNDPKLLEQAFTCPSAIKNKISHLNESYQKLEFLGDAILKTVITELIYQIYPSYNEGQLSKKREELEKNKALSVISKKIGLSEFAIRFKQEKSNFKMEADLIEALIGAIMVDSNYDYKTTRYHTLLLISDNVINDIDLELFFEYVSKCKNEIKSSNKLKEDLFQINNYENLNISENKKQLSFKDINIDDYGFDGLNVNESKNIESIQYEEPINNASFTKNLNTKIENINTFHHIPIYEDINNYKFDD